MWRVATEVDACQSGPCFPGVACLDLPPPSDDFDCGACPRFFEGNGRQCLRSGEALFPLCLSVCLSVCLSACLSVCQSVPPGALMRQSVSVILRLWGLPALLSGQRATVPPLW